MSKKQTEPNKQTTPPNKTTSPRRVDKLTNPNYLPTRDEMKNMTKEQFAQRNSNLRSRDIRDVKGRIK